MVEIQEKRRWKRSSRSSSSPASPINNLDDGCLMHIFSFLSPIPDRYNTALVCHRWCFLACHPRLWLRVDRSIKDPTEPGVFPDIETAISAARLVKSYPLIM
uniref:F-box domain-containing protein n=1 Tax=Nelumbo nucifera TaxID=4432 RepID=A0A822YDR0_NELNU|nr:TPA_asm: hypothetical protein HUJ06_030867 [Nelumbo nucifera]